MAKFINVQVNKANSAITINYGTPETSDHREEDGKIPESVIFAQVNDTKCDNSNVTGSGAILNLGYQVQKPENPPRMRDRFSAEYGGPGQNSGSDVRSGPWKRRVYFTRDDTSRGRTERNDRPERNAYESEENYHRERRSQRFSDSDEWIRTVRMTPVSGPENRRRYPDNNRNSRPHSSSYIDIETVPNKYHGI